MTIDMMLKHRHTVKLCWPEPWPACDPQGSPLTACVEYRATVHDCINIRRATEQANGRLGLLSDAELLEDFIAINWADVL